MSNYIYDGSLKSEKYKQHLDYYKGVLSGKQLQLGANELNEFGDVAYVSPKGIILEQKDFYDEKADLVTTYSYEEKGTFTFARKAVRGTMVQDYIGFQITEDGMIHGFDRDVAKEVYRDFFDKSTLLNNKDIDEEILNSPIILDDKYAGSINNLDDVQ